MKLFNKNIHIDILFIGKKNDIYIYIMEKCGKQDKKSLQ